jgi:hypothetical protein
MLKLDIIEITQHIVRGCGLHGPVMVRALPKPVLFLVTGATYLCPDKVVGVRRQ